MNLFTAICLCVFAGIIALCWITGETPGKVIAIWFAGCIVSGSYMELVCRSMEKTRKTSYGHEAGFAIFFWSLLWPISLPYHLYCRIKEI